MTNPTDDLLVTSEGVDEGSAASTDESPRSRPPGGASGAPAQGHGQPADGGASDATPAPPVDMESDQSRSARAAAGTGQQLEAGEG